jgi:diacylglycerol kinase (ATP)
VIAVIINPISGGARPGQAEARARVATDAVRANGEDAQVFVTTHGGHAHALAKTAAAAGARLVIAWGGDGTINETVTGLAFGQVPLGIIPAGSGNGFARELGVSLDPAQAFASALRATPRPCDVGEIEGRLFVCVAGIGLDAHVAHQFNAPGNVSRGFRGYIVITSRALFNYVPQRYRITSDVCTFETRAIVVTVANAGQFGNGARIAPNAKVDDGLLDLVTIEETSRLSTVFGMRRLFNGTVEQIRGCRIDRIRDVTIEAPLPMTFHVDGEPVEGGTTLRARVHPGALRISA